MDIKEFKIWFSGFVAGVDGQPTERQWERLQEEVAALDGGMAAGVTDVRIRLDTETTRTPGTEWRYLPLASTPALSDTVTVGSARERTSPPRIIREYTSEHILADSMIAGSANADH